MAKKSAATEVKPKPVVRVTPEEAKERAKKAAQDEWDRALSNANTIYDRAADAAWKRYKEALQADTNRKPGLKDYDTRYDQERQAAVDEFNRACKAMDAKLLSRR